MDGTAWAIISTLATALIAQSALLLRATLASLKQANHVIENQIPENTRALQTVAEVMRGCSRNQGKED